MGTKVLGTETNVTTATTLDSATVVRIYASATSVITIADDQAQTIGTMTMPTGRVEIIEKSATDTIAASVAVLCSKIAYT